MDAPPTPPPMTTARACFLKRSLGACLRRRDAGLADLSLGDGPVDDTDQQDEPQGELKQWDIANEARECDVRKRAHRWVLSTDRRVPRPQEVDLHRDTPDQAEDVDPESPLAELEWSWVLWPTLQPRQKDR